MSEGWYGVRCIFKKNGQNFYEERIVVWHAPTADAAIALAEADAEDYARILDLTYLGLCQSFAIFDLELLSGSEVFSLIRESPEDPNAYLKRHFNTGTEIQRQV